MKKITTILLTMVFFIGSVISVDAATIWWSNPNTYEGVDDGISDMLKIQTDDGSLQAYCIFNFNTGTIEYFDPICDKSNPIAVYIPSAINNVKVTGINSQALCSIFYEQSSMWYSNIGYTEIYVPSSITNFGDMAFYCGYIGADEGYTICCEENSKAWNAAQYEKRKACNVTEYSMNSVIDWNDYAVLMNQLTNGIAAPHKPIKVRLNGENIYFDQEPIIEDGRTLVPLRAIFEALGASVDWNSDTQTVTAQKDTTTVSLTIGSNILYKNDSAVELDVPAQIAGDRTLVPVRAVSEAFDCSVSWDEDNQTVIINK